MRVAIAGGHGQIALRLEKVLKQQGHEPVALIRNPDHAGDVEQAGAEPAVVDLDVSLADGETWSRLVAAEAGPDEPLSVALFRGDETTPMPRFEAC